VEYNDNFRYYEDQNDVNNSNNDSLNIQQQLDKEKKKREESDRKIKELEKKQKEPKQSTGKRDSEDDGTVAKASRRIFSLTEAFF